MFSVHTQSIGVFVDTTQRLNSFSGRISQQNKHFNMYTETSKQ